MQTDVQSWEDRGIRDLEVAFWKWSECLEFLALREQLLLTSKEYQLLAKRMTTEHSLDIPKVLFPDALAEKFHRMNAPIVKHQIPIRKRSQSPIQWDEKVQGQVVEISVSTNCQALNAGHFGIIFPYVTFGSTESVLKLLRYEHVKKPLDIYSFVMEIIIGILIQARGLTCTPRIINVIRTDKMDVGLVMEKLTTSLRDFFFKGAGASDVRLGLLILIELAQKVHFLQVAFKFRHRDLRAPNVMLKYDGEEKSQMTPQPGNLRIIDLGKSSIYFKGKLFSSYSGWKYHKVRKDFDLGFFFCDMLLQFEKRSDGKRPLEMYEPIIRPFLRGIRYDDLAAPKQSNIYSTLMSRVHHRDSSTRFLTRPKYINQQLTLLFNQLTKPST